MNRLSFFAFLFLFVIAVANARDSEPPPVTVDASEYGDLQAALDAIPASGGMLKLPPGRIEISEPLIVRGDDIRIEGAGAATQIVNRNEEGEAALHLRSDGQAENPRERLWRIQLADFRLSGNERSGDGVLAEGINEIFIHGLSVDRHGGHGINLVNCFENPRVTDNSITYNGKAGLNIHAGHDIVVNGNQFEENQDGVRCVDGFNLTMNGNNLDDHLRHGLVMENTYGSVISGNMIEECQGLAVVLDRDCYGITLSSNVIAHDFGGGIDLRDAWGCAISANTFVLVHEFGIRVGPDSGRLTISSNTFSNSYRGDDNYSLQPEHENKMRRDTGNGILLQETEDIAIVGNLFSGLDGAAVTADGPCVGINITGNTITDFARRGPATPAINLPDLDGNLIENNIIRSPKPD